MRVKKWLTLSYVIVMIIPIITGFLIYKAIRYCSENVEFNDYMTSINKIQKYEKILENPNLYIKVNKNLNILKDEDLDMIQIDLYNKLGAKIYSSNTQFNDQGVFLSSNEHLYRNLYEFQRGYRANTIKKPVFLNGDIVGIYEITIVRNKLVENVNNVCIIAITIFVLILILLFIFIMYILNKKLTKPIKKLTSAMKFYAKGESDISIDYNKNDEIGDLINHFLKMKDDIDKSKKELEMQQKDKEYLIAAISHDLKTPLTAIRAYGEALKEYENLSKSDVGLYTSVIINKSDYMKNMLDELFTYTILNNQYVLEKVEVDCEEFMDMLFYGYNELIESKGAKLVKNINVIGEVNVEVKSMIRVVDNLINNALRYVPLGGTIELGAYSEQYKLPVSLGYNIINQLDEMRKNSLIIFVRNDGSPIEDKEKERIFDAFYQSDDSRNKKNNNGTGLGLSIVKLIIEKHEGIIKLISNDEIGTLIACIIPMYKIELV